MIVTSLLLLLCQTEPAPVTPPISTPAQTPAPTSAPRLSMGPDSWEIYDLAMHIIDVRGRYEEGAEKLLELVDRQDVFSDRGQASWMLAQAARALTLAGKNDEAAKLLPGARNGSRNTIFEDSIDALLASFAPQSAGLDPEFLQYVRTQITLKAGPSNLSSNYGRELLPYLRFILQNEQGEFLLEERQEVIGSLFRLMDFASATWLSKQLQGIESLAARGLLQQLSAFETHFFLDLEARDAALGVMLRFSEEGPESLRNLCLDVLLNLSTWRVLSGSIQADSSTNARILARVQELIEAGYRGDRGFAFRRVLQLYTYPELKGGPIARALANSQVAEVREGIRWELLKSGVDIESFRQWALEGALVDQLRFVLLLESNINYLLTSKPRGKKPELNEWGASFFSEESPMFPFLGMTVNGISPRAQDYEILASLASSPHPLVKYLAASTLLTRHHFAEAMAFFENPGEDIRWATFLLEDWISWSSGDDFRIPAEIIDVLVPLAEDGPLQQLFRRLLETQGHDVVTVELWEQLSLQPSGFVGKAVVRRAAEREATEDLVWIALHGGRTSGYTDNAFSWLSNDWPRQYLAHLKEFEAASRRWSRRDKENWAWDASVQNEGKTLLSTLEQELERSLFYVVEGKRNSKLLYIVAREDPDLTIKILTRHIQNPDEILWAMNSSAIQKLRPGKNAEAMARFAMDLLEAGYVTLFENPRDRLFRTLMDPTLSSFEPSLAVLWKQPHSQDVLMEYLITETYRNTSMRQRFQEELIHQMKTPKWTKMVVEGYANEGALKDILDDVLALFEEPLSTDNHASVLYSLGYLDDERVIQVLMENLEDPRPEISAAASSSLSRIKSIRSQKKHWESWGNGEDGVPLSTVEALLKNLSDPELEIRLVSIQSLGTLGDKDVLPALINLLRDENSQIKEAARQALDRINKVDFSQEQTKAQLTLHLTKLEGELAALQGDKTEQHPQVVALQKKIEITKTKLEEYSKD